MCRRGFEKWRIRFIVVPSQHRRHVVHDIRLPRRGHGGYNVVDVEVEANARLHDRRARRRRRKLLRVHEFANAVAVGGVPAASGDHIGGRKRALIHERADELGIRVLNRRRGL